MEHNHVTELHSIIISRKGAKAQRKKKTSRINLGVLVLLCQVSVLSETWIPAFAGMTRINEVSFLRRQESIFPNLWEHDKVELASWREIK